MKKQTPSITETNMFLWTCDEGLKTNEKIPERMQQRHSYGHGMWA